MLIADFAPEYPFWAERVSLGVGLIRFILGVTLAAHGYGKFFRGGRIPGTAGWFDSMGMRPGKLHAYLAASTEVGAGLLFAVGLFTPLAAAGMVAVMTVAAWTVHRPNGFFIVGDGWEYNFILAVVAVGIATTGPGQYSLDYEFGLLDTDFDGINGLLIAGVGGVLAAVAQMAIFYRPPKPDPES
ncbi:MAG: DoxX family protein [Acidimicrobiales bacterium]